MGEQIWEGKSIKIQMFAKKIHTVGEFLQIGYICVAAIFLPDDIFKVLKQSLDFIRTRDNLKECEL